MKYQNWGWPQVAAFNGIRYNPNMAENYVPCPFCGGKRFAMNIKKETGHCWTCGQTADIAAYHAALNSMSIDEARKDLDEKVGAGTENFVRPERIVIKDKPQSKLASIDVLDSTYRAFLAELHLSEKNRAMLLARGFNPADIERYGYKTFPAYSDEYYAICRRLIAAGNCLEGVPGFFQTKYGDWTFVRCTQGIIIPQKTVNNKIFGLQIRKDDDLRVMDSEGKLESKCTWFSSKNCLNGVKAQADINFSCDFKFDQKTNKYWIYSKSKKVVLTEGGMKADLIHAIEPDMPVISEAGVNFIKPLRQTLKYLGKLGIETVILAFDMDYLTNQNVSNAMVEVESAIQEAGMNCKKVTWNTNVTIDGSEVSLLKGLDDYLAYHKRGIVPKLINKED